MSVSQFLLRDRSAPRPAPYGVKNCSSRDRSGEGEGEGEKRSGSGVSFFRRRSLIRPAGFFIGSRLACGSDCGGFRHRGTHGISGNSTRRASRTRRCSRGRQRRGPGRWVGGRARSGEAVVLFIIRAAVDDDTRVAPAGVTTVRPIAVTEAARIIVDRTPRSPSASEAAPAFVRFRTEAD